MRNKRLLQQALYLVTLLTLSVGGLHAHAGELLVEGDFEATKSGKYLRQDNKGQDWYESRKDTDSGRDLLKLSTKDIGGNATRKAMIKGSPEFNTYLTQKLSEPQSIFLSVQYDIFVKEILPTDNRSAFFFVGAIKDKKGGPNSTRRERFVMIGFENGAEEGKINLLAREGDTSWADRTIIASDLDLNRWYTIKVNVNIQEAVYEVEIDGVGEIFELEAHSSKGRFLDELTHISFASWNDGAGTFYVDNVMARD